jgi:hypothetical protein
MSKVKQTNIGSDVYRRIHEAQMSDIERQAALRAMRNAEAMVEFLVWAKNKVAAAGTYFLKPSLKH